MTDLINLAERCEQATGPDRELDMAICLALDTGRRVTGDGRWLGPDPFTASLDAAMTLLPGKDWEWSLEWESGSLLFHPDIGQYARAKIGDPMLRMEAEAATPALALCAAALRARAGA